MAQKFLNPTKISSAVKQVCGRRVPKCMGSRGSGARCVLEQAPREFVHGSRVHSCASCAEEQCVGRLYVAEFPATPLQPIHKRGRSWLPKRHDPLFVPFTYNANNLLVDVNRVDVERAEFRDASASGVQQLDDREVA